MAKSGDKKKGGKATRGARKCNPYICFVKEQRPGLVKSQPQLQPKEIMKKIGEMWRCLSDADKNKYQEMAKVEDKKNGIPDDQ